MPDWAKKLSSSIKELAQQVEELRTEGIKVHHDGISMGFVDQKENNENDQEAYNEEELIESDENASPRGKRKQQGAKSAPITENGLQNKSPRQKPSAAKTNKSK